MNKIYIVTEESNKMDDGEIAGIFSTRRLAGRFMRHYHTNGRFTLHERGVFGDWTEVEGYMEGDEKKKEKKEVTG